MKAGFESTYNLFLSNSKKTISDFHLNIVIFNHYNHSKLHRCVKVNDKEKLRAQLNRLVKLLFTLTKLLSDLQTQIRHNAASDRNFQFMLLY